MELTAYPEMSLGKEKTNGEEKGEKKERGEGRKKGRREEEETNYKVIHQSEEEKFRIEEISF